ncbi:MAG TPA: hypothetical protein V6D48_05825 [Oculatellaceae cyanobacterium]
MLLSAARFRQSSGATVYFAFSLAARTRSRTSCLRSRRGDIALLLGFMFQELKFFYEIKVFF